MSTQHGSLSSQTATRLQGGQLILKGYDNDEIIDIVETSNSSVKRWKKKLKQHGDNLACLVRKKGSGRHAKLNNAQKQQLKEIISEGAVAAGYAVERWTSKIVADLILKTFGITMAARSVRKMLHTLGLSPQMPVVKSHKYSEEAVLQWAKQTWKRLKKKRRDLASP
jgi:putative transposase